MPERTYDIPAVGQSHHNRDGSYRQALIARLDRGDPVWLRPEPDNPHDPRALAVDCAAGQIGYVGRDQPWLLDRVLEGRVVAAAREAGRLAGRDRADGGP